MTYNQEELGLWHHDIDLKNGSRTGSLSAPYNGKAHVNKDGIAKEIFDLYGSSLKNKKVLDIACNAGGHLYSLNKYGIAYGLGFDVREAWIKQANWVQQITKDTNLKFVNSSFEILDNCDVFDIALFNGIFYHLFDPLEALKKVADKTTELLTINTAYQPSTDAMPAMICRVESKRIEDGLSGVEGISWAPNGEQVLIDILKPLGFIEFNLRFKNPEAKRLCLFASKVKGLLC